MVNPLIFLVRPAGFEPATSRFVVWRSIQLNYGRVIDLKKWRRERDLNPRYTFTAYNRLAGDRFRPLSHLSAIEILLAEGAGFEPARLSPNGFQDRRHRPLGHPSSVFHRTCRRAITLLKESCQSLSCRDARLQESQRCRQPAGNSQEPPPPFAPRLIPIRSGYGQNQASPSLPGENG